MSTQTSRTTFSGPGNTSQARHCPVVYRSTWNLACWEPNCVQHALAREGAPVVVLTSSFSLFVESFYYLLSRSLLTDRASSSTSADFAVPKSAYIPEDESLGRSYFQGHFGVSCCFFPAKFHENLSGVYMAQEAVIAPRAALPAWHSLLRREGCDRSILQEREREREKKK